jgi:hypothetical protein
VVAVVKMELLARPAQVILQVQLHHKERLVELGVLVEFLPLAVAAVVAVLLAKQVQPQMAQQVLAALVVLDLQVIMLMELQMFFMVAVVVAVHMWAEL